jgi:demethylmenaquinone methyltransferase/2-methoxy-6-polyprenyl-1,4-benzoquinol methylase
MEWHCRDAVQTGLPPACADAVSCSFGLRNMQNRQALYREIRRLLKPQARTGLLEFSVPPTGLRRHLYLCYLRHVLPWIGAMVSGRVTPYRYLSRTIQQFPPPERIVHELVTAGFADVQTSPLDGAIVTMYTACI